MEEGEVNMTITTVMEDLLKGDPFFLEIEMMKAERVVLSNGLVKYSSLIIEDEFKKELMKEFVLRAISLSVGFNKN